MYSNDSATWDWYAVAKAIRNYLMHDYACAKFGIDTDPAPMKISAYNGKGVGYYPTAPDGRADWTTEFYRYMERAESRMTEHGDLRFGFREVDAAMEQLKIDHSQWYDVLEMIDMRGMNVGEVADTMKKDESTIKRYRTRATEYLFRCLVAVPAKARKLHVKIIQVV